MALKRFFTSQDVKEMIGGVMTGRIRLKGAGDTVRNALATSNGNIALVVESGHISNLIVELIGLDAFAALGIVATDRSEEHTSELQSLMRYSSAVFCLTK